jgi:hypothetical protein
MLPEQKERTEKLVVYGTALRRGWHPAAGTLIHHATMRPIHLLDHVELAAPLAP